VKRLFYFAPLSLLVAGVVIIGYANRTPPSTALTSGAPVTHVITAPATLEGEFFPDITAPGVDGLSEGWSTADFATDFPGRVVVVNVWGSWCAPCRAEHPLLTQLADEGAPIYGLAWNDTDQGAAAFLDRFGNPFTAVGLDVSGDIGAQLDLTGAPETFVIGADGVVRVHAKGPIDAGFIDRRIRPLLAQGMSATRQASDDQVTDR